LLLSMNKSLCQFPGCINNGRYCRIQGHIPEEIAPRKTIAAVSKKRDKINRQEYKPIAQKYLQAHPRCELQMEGCTQKAQGIHHLKGKSSTELLLDVRFFKAACNHCNLMVEVKDQEAREKELKLSKFS
jgi:hypothetical protein